MIPTLEHGVIDYDIRILAEQATNKSEVNSAVRTGLMGIWEGLGTFVQVVYGTHGRPLTSTMAPGTRFEGTYAT